MAIKYSIQDALKSAVRKVRRFAYAHPLPPRSSRQHRPPRLGLALGGGFARGLAHLGVLKVLVENHIPIDALAGTSVGSVVAAAFASGSTIEEMIEEARTTRWKDVARWTIARLGFASNAPLEALLGRALHASRFDQLRIPLAVVATDVSTGQAVTFRQGELIPALRASCSFPGLFVPVEYQGRLLVDGALVGSVPGAALREMGAEKIIAVHLKAGDPRRTPSNVFQVVGQAFQIVASLGREAWGKGCDVVIEPDTTGLGWDDFERADELILAGERAARQALPALRALLNTQSGWALGRPVPAR